MSKSTIMFLQNQIQKGGQNAYCAMLILGATEKDHKDVLKKFNIEVVQSILNEYKQTA